MSRSKSLQNMSVAELEQLLAKRLMAEHDEKQAQLTAAKAKVKELEAYFASQGKNPREGRTSAKAAPMKIRRKRGGLRAAVLVFLAKGKSPLKDIVAGVHGNYGTVAQLVAKLKKEKVIFQGAGRGAAYFLAK
jgi:predicted transcriptional regulator